MCLLAVTAICALLMVLFFKGGPYVRPNAYEKNSLRESWWGARYLKSEHCYEVNESKEDIETLDCKLAIVNSAIDSVPDKSIGNFEEEPETNRALINMNEMQPVASRNDDSNLSSPQTSKKEESEKFDEVQDNSIVFDAERAFVTSS